jgi:hypothetical protein
MIWAFPDQIADPFQSAVHPKLAFQWRHCVTTFFGKSGILYSSGLNSFCQCYDYQPYFTVCCHLSEKFGRDATKCPSVFPSFCPWYDDLYSQYWLQSLFYAGICLRSLGDMPPGGHLSPLFLSIEWRPLFTILTLILMLCCHLSKKCGRSATWRPCVLFSFGQWYDDLYSQE